MIRHLLLLRAAYRENARQAYRVGQSAVAQAWESAASAVDALLQLAQADSPREEPEHD